MPAEGSDWSEWVGKPVPSRCRAPRQAATRRRHIDALTSCYFYLLVFIIQCAFVGRCYGVKA